MVDPEGIDAHVLEKAKIPYHRSSACELFPPVLADPRIIRTIDFAVLIFISDHPVAMDNKRAIVGRLAYGACAVGEAPNDIGSLLDKELPVTVGILGQV